jgi:elongation factor P
LWFKVSHDFHVTLKIVEADPSSYKRALLENGLRVLVPPFIGSGEQIVDDTSEVTYMRPAD